MGRSGGVRRSLAAVGLGVILATTVVTLAGGAALKAPCAGLASWRTLIQYRAGCYSDIVPLSASERFAGGRLPYLDGCGAMTSSPCDEYPPVTMYFMRATAWLSRSSSSFFWASAVGLSVLALVTALILYRLAGARALYLAAAPTVLLYGAWNWDLLAVALTTGATLLFLRRREGWSGLLLGLGVAAKLYPILVLFAFVVDRLRAGRRRQAAVLVGAAAGAWALTNVPFMLTAFGPWSFFFRFSSQRPLLYDSVWYVACTRYVGGTTCPWAWDSLLTDAAGLVAGAVVVGLAWWARARRAPGFPLWTLGFPLVAAFILTNKVSSPQYGLWLLPWFALTVPRVWVFVAFELSEVATWFATIGWQGRLALGARSSAIAFTHRASGLAHAASAVGGYTGLPYSLLQATVVARDLILLTAIVLWATQEPLPDALRLRVGRARPSQDTEPLRVTEPVA